MNSTSGTSRREKSSFFHHWTLKVCPGNVILPLSSFQIHSFCFHNFRAAFSFTNKFSPSIDALPYKTSQREREGEASKSSRKKEAKVKNRNKSISASSALISLADVIEISYSAHRSHSILCVVREKTSQDFQISFEEEHGRKSRVRTMVEWDFCYADHSARHYTIKQKMLDFLTL